MLRLKVSKETLIVIVSVIVQLPLAIFLGHYYDDRSFIDTGYLVSSGLNPYLPFTVRVFSNSHLIGVNPIIGYPPLWPLLLGLIYRLTYNILPNIFLYNFAIKLPVIASNIGLAYTIKNIMQRLDMSKKIVQFAWLFLLFNPFTLLTTTAWGEFDTLIALLCVASLYFLSKNRIVECSLLLSLSIVLKPISLPLIGLPLLYSAPQATRRNLIYLFFLVATVLIFWFLPFLLLGWALPVSQDLATSYFRSAGGMTVFNVFEITQNVAGIPAGFEFLGYLWIPALIMCYFVFYRKRPSTISELIESAVVLLFVFFLIRTWLSEPNINLLLVLSLMLVGFGKISQRNFHLLWIVPMVFLFLNYAFPQLFFLVYPPIIPEIATLDLQIGAIRLFARFAVTIVWYLFALKILFLLLHRKEK